MKPIATTTVCSICLYFGLLGAWVEAAPPMSWDRSFSMSFSSNPSSGRPMNSFVGAQYSGPAGRQMSFGPTIQRGYMPGWTGGQPYMPNTQYPSSSWQGSSQPRLEVGINHPSPYVNQTVLYTVRTVSSNNIKTINLDLPVITGVVLDKIDGPVTKLRRRGRGSEIVNEYRFALTPLNDGEIVIAPVRVSGTQASTNQWGQSGSVSNFNLVSSGPLRLQVRPAVASIQPWLPLRNLRIDGKLGQQNNFEPGEPLTLSIQLSALGASGSRLPSLESQLQTPGARVYREASKTTQFVSVDGRELRGNRNETYTMVPLEGETLKLPTLRVAWWNVDTSRQEEAVLPIASLFSNWNASDQTDGTWDTSIKLSIWMPFLIILIATISYWLGLWSRDSRLGYRIRHRLGVIKAWLSHRLATRGQRFMKRLAPRARWLGIQNYMVSAMPMSFRLWFCARCVDYESNPSNWCRMFRSMAGKHLSMTEQAPLPKLAQNIIEVHPGVQPTKLHELVTDLDGAIYGSESLDFEAWKREFKHQLRPHLFARKRTRSKRSDAELPDLNPKAAA